MPQTLFLCVYMCVQLQPTHITVSNMCVPRQPMPTMDSYYVRVRVCAHAHVPRQPMHTMDSFQKAGSLLPPCEEGRFMFSGS